MKPEERIEYLLVHFTPSKRKRKSDSPYWEALNALAGIKPNAVLGASEKGRLERESWWRNMTFLAGMYSIQPEGMLKHEAGKLLLSGWELSRADFGAAKINKARKHGEAILRLMGKIQKAQVKK
jgi:hypothetical protein